MENKIRPEKLRLLEQSKNRAIQMAKAHALNEIAKIFHPLYKGRYSHYPDDGGYAEQDRYKIENLIRNMNKQIKEAKLKYKKLANE